MLLSFNEKNNEEEHYLIPGLAAAAYVIHNATRMKILTLIGASTSIGKIKFVREN
jgi:hypothetical protein